MASNDKKICISAFPGFQKLYVSLACHIEGRRKCLFVYNIYIVTPCHVLNRGKKFQTIYNSKYMNYEKLYFK